MSNKNLPDDLISIDTRLAEIESEKARLLIRRNELTKSEKKHSSKEPLLFKQLSPEQKVAVFKNYFQGRTDIFANRWQNQQGRSGYSVACNNEWVQGVCNKPKIKCQDCNYRQFTQLSDEVIYRHLVGQQVVGLYPLLQDNTCYLLAADFDKAGWQEEVKAMAEACQQYQIPHIIEISRSGNGAHLWVFFTEKVPAREARMLGFGLLDKAMEIYPNLSFDSYDRLFPNQDILPEGGFGNLIALPLQKQVRALGNSLFVDAELTPYEDQWQHLAKAGKLSPQELNKILTTISPNATLFTEQAVVDSRPPWEIGIKPNPLKLQESPTQITITLANHIYFDLAELPNALAARMRRLASFSNPVFFKTQALRFSTHGIPRFICCARIEQGYLVLPRGCLDDALALLQEQNIKTIIDDKREFGIKLKKPKLFVSLRKNQQDAIKKMLRHDTGVLHAPTAFGKTITAIGLIAKRKCNTLILVHSRQLLDQWQERLRSFLPELEIGVIRGGKKKPTGVIDIATYQSLINKKDNTVSMIVQDYGHDIVDECHHVSAPRFEMVLNEVRAKYVLGLTATPERQDGHQKIIFMAAGPIRHRVKSQSEDQFTQDVLVRNLYDKPPTTLTQTEERPKISDAYRWLMENDARTQQIIDDVKACLKKLRHPIILTERREHAENINTLLNDDGIDSLVLKGAMRSTERKNVEERLPNAQVIVATGKYVGEGFDLPRLDTLFLAMPIAWKGSLAQYAGRIHRISDGKERVIIYDYVDCALPMLQRMFNKREKSYKSMGYHIEHSESRVIES